MPKQFDVILCDNMFGGILSEEAVMLTGCLGMLYSVSPADGICRVNGSFDGSAPDIAQTLKRAPCMSALFSVEWFLNFISELR